jgi:hypothetical protein
VRGEQKSLQPHTVAVSKMQDSVSVFYVLEDIDLWLKWYPRKKSRYVFFLHHNIYNYIKEGVCLPE